MIRPNEAVFRAALAGIKAAAQARSDALRATCAGSPDVAAWLALQASRWDAYVAAIADESIAEATRSVATCRDPSPDVPQAVTPPVQSGTKQP